MPDSQSATNVAIVHDVALTRGGGMRVVEEAARTFGADLYVGMLGDGVRKRSPIEITPLFDRIVEHGTLRGLYFMQAFRNRPELHEYDAVVLSGSGTYWYRPQPRQRTVWYVHAIPLSYGQEGLVAALSRRLRSSTFSHPDTLLANSTATRDQIRTHWGRKADIVYPPVDVSAFDACEGKQGRHLTISRLTDNKGVREVVEVYNGRDEELAVVGDGPLLEGLRDLAAENVTVTGYVSERRKRDLLQDASAFVLNSGNESFGITAIEALASGTPVIAKDGGYTPHLIDDGRTGIVYEGGRLEAALNRFTQGGVSASATQLNLAAQEFGIGRFREGLKDSVSGW